ncbi:hypothetical protein, partial [Aeromonas caviae]
EQLSPSNGNPPPVTRSAKVGEDVNRSLLRWVREMVRTSPTSVRNRVKKTFHEAYAHRLVGDEATYEAAMHLCKAVFGQSWVED